MLEKDFLKPSRLVIGRMIGPRLSIARLSMLVFLVGLLLTSWLMLPELPELSELPEVPRSWEDVEWKFNEQVENFNSQVAKWKMKPTKSIQAPLSSQTANSNRTLLAMDKAEKLCAKADMKPWPDRNGTRKVYDLFLVGSELDWVEIRMNELAPYVDYFVILEAEHTFTNHSKPKYFKKNWQHFSRFEPQIIYHVLNEDAIRKSGNPWERERYQRNALVTQIFPSLLGDQAPRQGDVMIVSDVDEIPRPETVQRLRNCDFPDRTGIQSRFFLYSFQLHRTDMDWYHPQATFWQGENTILPESLRMDPVRVQLPNAAWHCTTCFSTVAELVQKIDSFSHQEFNKPEFKDANAIVDRVRNGKDVFDREYPYERLEQQQLDAPEYLLQHRRKFAYLVDRDPPNANFWDYRPTGDGNTYDKTATDESTPAMHFGW